MKMIEITPGDDNHLTMMMMKYHFNHVTGKDREHLLAYAKDVWSAAVAEEREANARICDDLHHAWRWGDEPDSESGPRQCAKAIRQRTVLKDEVSQ